MTFCHWNDSSSASRLGRIMPWWTSVVLDLVFPSVDSGPGAGLSASGGVPSSDLEHDLAANMFGLNQFEGVGRALEGNEVLDFHSQPFVVDHAGDLREPVAIGPDDVFAIDADSGRHLGDRPGEVDHPPALAERPHHLVRRLARNAVEHLVNAAWISGADRRDDVLGRVVDDRLGPEGADEVVVPLAGGRHDARPDPRGDLDGQVANPARSGRDQYHVAALDRKDVRQGLMRGQPDNRYPARPR